MEVNPALFDRLHRAIDENRKSDAVMLLRQIFNSQNKSDFDRDRDYLLALVDLGDHALSRKELELAERYFSLALRLHEALFQDNLTEGLAAARRYCELLEAAQRTAELETALSRTFRIIKNMRTVFADRRQALDGTTGGVTIYSMSRDAAAESTKRKPLRVLYVEDNPDDVELLKETLMPGEPLIIEWTDHLQLALRKLRSGHVDAVLLDLGLPDSAEIDTVRSISNEAPGIPIVVLTGNLDKDLAISSLKNGARDILHKQDLAGSDVVAALKKAIVQRQRELFVVRDREARLETARVFVTHAVAPMALIDTNMNVVEANSAFEAAFAAHAPTKGKRALDSFPTFTRHDLEAGLRDGKTFNSSILSIDSTDIHQIQLWPVLGGDGSVVGVVLGKNQNV